MLRTLVIVILMTPAAALAQGRQEILLGQTLSGALGPDDRSRDGRPFDDFEYSAEPGTELRVIVRSSSMAVDVNVYFFDEYFDLLPLESGGAAPEGEVEVTVPDAGFPTPVVFRVSTVAGDSGPSTGDYTIELVGASGPVFDYREMHPRRLVVAQKTRSQPVAVPTVGQSF